MEKKGDLDKSWYYLGAINKPLLLLDRLPPQELF